MCMRLRGLRLRLRRRREMRLGLPRARPIAPAGLSHYRRGGRRIHLRVDSCGSGILGVDASRILHLNGTACDMVWLVLEGLPRDQAVRRMRKTWRVSRETAEKDFDDMRRILDAFVEDSPVCPVTFLGLDRLEPFTTPVEAPYRADLALTYRCNLDCGHCYNQRRDTPELPTGDWTTILGKLWDNGIPHAVFTGGEATLRPDLSELVAFAESVGMVTGLLTNGVRLADGDYLGSLVAAGLDYVQITLESADEGVHNSMTGAASHGPTMQALRNCLREGVYTITNTTLTKANLHTARATVDLLASLGLKSFAMNGMIHSGKGPSSGLALETWELAPALRSIHEQAERLGLRMIWYSPTRYCELDPLELELGPKRCTAGQYNICIEPDGSVLPCQSYYESAGNILADDWDTIYNSGLFDRVRSRAWVPEKCRDCPELPLCGGGCPLEAEGRGVACPDMLSNP